LFVKHNAPAPPDTFETDALTDDNIIKIRQGVSATIQEYHNRQMMGRRGDSSSRPAVLLNLQDGTVVWEADDEDDTGDDSDGGTDEDDINGVEFVEDDDFDFEEHLGHFHDDEDEDDEDGWTDEDGDDDDEGTHVAPPSAATLLGQAPSTALDFLQAMLHSTNPPHESHEDEDEEDDDDEDDFHIAPAGVAGLNANIADILNGEYDEDDDETDGLD
jgi:hypothetical protein